MPSFYSVVRYVPDVIADERINIGVVVFGEGRIRAHFLQNWQRVQRFGGGSVAFLKNFAKEFPQAQLHLLFESPKWDEASLQKVVGKWKNCIQLSEAYASLKSVDELLAEVTNRFLREEQSHAQTAVRESYGRSRVVSDGIRIVKAVLSEHVGRRIASEIVKKN